ncbi:MAG: GFA family protein [Propionivibrio sp.]
MADPIRGACLCGAVRYECTAEPMFAVNCHCRDCQRASGSAYLPVLMVPAAALKVVGEVCEYAKQGDRGFVARRSFCPVCGSQLFACSDGMPDWVGLRAGTLDDPSRYRPQADIYTRSAHAWDVMAPETAKFDTLPPPQPAPA